MKNSRVSFNFLDRVYHDQVGYKEITYHLIFDVKIYPNRKARYVADGNLTDTTLSMTYAIVVSCDSVILVLLIAALDDLYILAGDTQNAYLNAPKIEKVFYMLEMNENMTMGKLLLLLEFSLV